LGVLVKEEKGFGGKKERLTKRGTGLTCRVRLKDWQKQGGVRIICQKAGKVGVRNGIIGRGRGSRDGKAKIVSYQGKKKKNKKKKQKKKKKKKKKKTQKKKKKKEKKKNKKKTPPQNPPKKKPPKREEEAKKKKK